MLSVDVAPTRIAEWHKLVHDARELSGHKIHDDIECYLIMTLDSFITEMSYISKALALDFLTALALPNVHDRKLIRNVGDSCLIMTGLFPEQAKRRNVSVDYYIKLGQQAYHIVADDPYYNHWDPVLFTNLRDHFTVLMEILRAIRAMPFQNLLLKF